MDNITARQAIAKILTDTTLFPVNPNKLYEIQDIYEIVDAHVPQDIQETVDDFHKNISAFFTSNGYESPDGTYRLYRNIEKIPKNPKAKHLRYYYVFLENEPAK